MNISLRLLKSISLEELTFVFSMMRKYGGMPDPTLEPSNKHNKHNKHKTTNTKQKCPSDRSKCKSKFPCLYHLDCIAWDKCQDEKFLTYRDIMTGYEKKDN